VRRRERQDTLLGPFGTAAVLFTLLLAVMTAHQAEHVAQIWQKDVALASCPNECRGLLGFVFDIEWIHFAYNTSILVAVVVLYAWTGLWRPEWRRAAPAAWTALTGAIVLQGYHVVEHMEKLQQWLANGHRSPTPGILGTGLAPADGRNFSLIELHFLFNTVVFVGIVVGYFGLGFHRRAWATRTPRRLALAAAAAGASLVATGAGYAASPPTVRLESGAHQGPLVLDEPQRLVGEPGAVVRGGIVVRSDDVVVKDVTVVGGENGIEVRDSDEVVLERVVVRGARMDGITARRSAVIVRDCRVAMAGAQTHGIELSFSMAERPSRVEGCTVTGGDEGIVAHLSNVTIVDNRVERTAMRAISISEMAMASVLRNRIGDARGVGIFCNDYSICKIRRNIVRDLRPDASGSLTRRGFAIVAAYHANARIAANVAIGSTRGPAEFSYGTLARD
jgi:hypothetical protein